MTGKNKKINIKNTDFNSRNIIEISKFDIEASMGKLPPDFLQTVSTVTVDKDFFINQGINITSDSKLSIITMEHNMDGIFNNEDLVVVNHDIQRLDTDGIYVFTLSDKLYLKRLQQILPSFVSMISDNSLTRLKEMN